MTESGKNINSRSITAIVRKWLVICFAVMYLGTVLALGVIQQNIGQTDSDGVLTLSVADVKKDISDTSDEYLLSLARIVADYVNNMDKYTEDEAMLEMIESYGIKNDDKRIEFLNYVAMAYDINEISVIDKNGIIIFSTNEEYIGFDMASGEQSAEFLCLLDSEEEYVQAYMPITYDNAIAMKYAGVCLKDGGFVQVGYNSERFRRDIDERVRGATKNRHVGETGYLMIISEDGVIVSSPYEETLGRNISDYEGFSVDLLESRMSDEPFDATVKGERYRCLGSKVESYYIFALIPMEEMISSIRGPINMMNAAELVTFVILFAMIFLLIKKLVSSNIQKIDESLSRIAAGDLDVDVDAQGTSEFESLSENINTTVEYLQDLMEKESERIGKELEYAKVIQRSALPSLFPPFPERSDFEIYALMDPAKEVGGDFFDFELLDGTALGFCVADVSGKGIPASLFMMRAKTLIKSYGIAGLRADEILNSVNNELCKNNESGMFLTCWLGILNTETGVIEYANAGHNPPLIRHENGDFEYLNSNKPNFILAGMEDLKYRRYETMLAAGDEIFLYTDGVTEATDANNKLFGEPRLLDALNSMKESSCAEKCSLLRGKIDEFVGEAPQFDDITMLSLRYYGSGDTMTCEAVMENYDKAVGFIEQKAEEYGCPMKLIPKINVAVDEVVTNIISYAYGDAIGLMSVEVLPCECPRKGICISFIDRGVPFNPLDNPDPDVNATAEDRQIGKLGIYMVKKLMDKVEYEYSNGNRLMLTKYFE